MKKFTLRLMLSLCFLMAASGLFAGSIDYLSNQSANWQMTPSRNAATDDADIANFNPAGTVFLPKGLSLNLSNQFLFKFYHNDNETSGTMKNLLGDSNKDLTPKVLTPLLPNLYAVYNFGQLGMGNLAVYLQAGVVAGGGTLEYSDGNAATTFMLGGLSAQLLQSGISTGPISSQSLEASSIYYNIGLGGAYSFLDDKLSVSLGARMVIARKSFILEASYNPGYNVTADFEYNAFGVTPIIGFDVRPIKGLTIAARYEIETQLEFEYQENKISGSLATAGKGLLNNAGIADGKKINYNLPHLIGLGVEYQINDALAVSTSENIYLLSVADYGENTGDYFGVGYDIAVGATYKILENLKLGAGINYTESGAKDKYFEDTATLFNASANPALDSVSFGLGATYSFKFGLDATISCLFSHYLPQDYSFSTQVFTDSGTYEKDVFMMGIGLSYHY
ncbi:OmpP1/FadL family transporter [Breznakiellaceae bacterium SP9]